MEEVYNLCPEIASKKCAIAAASLLAGYPIPSYCIECKNKAKTCLDRITKEKKEKEIKL